MMGDVFNMVPGASWVLQEAGEVDGASIGGKLTSMLRSGKGEVEGEGKIRLGKVGMLAR